MKTLRNYVWFLGTGLLFLLSGMASSDGYFWTSVVFGSIGWFSLFGLTAPENRP